MHLLLELLEIFARRGHCRRVFVALVLLGLGPLGALAQQASAVRYADRRIPSPIYFIDAVQRDSTALRQLNPAAIDKIVVVKAPRAHQLAPQFPDADARGLILITTKANANSAAVQRLDQQLRGGQAQTPAVPGPQVQSAPPFLAPETRITLDGPRPKRLVSVIYLDGQRRDSTILAKINPATIASIDALKDSAIARQLGPDEARLGVVFITTKAGQHTHRVRAFNKRLARLKLAQPPAASGSVAP